jgi:hypothetical protein
MRAVAIALTRHLSRTAHISRPLLSFSSPNGVDTPDGVVSKSGARARTLTAECRGRFTGRRKEPA